MCYSGGFPANGAGQVGGEVDTRGMLTTTAWENNEWGDTGGGGEDDSDDNRFDKNDK